MICPGMRELSVVLSRASGLQWRIKALPYLGASFRIWQCASVTRHFVRLVTPLSQGTSRVTHAGHRKASEHRCLVWKSFPLRLSVVALVNLSHACRVLSSFLWRISFSLLAPWIQLMLLSVLKGFRYLYGVDMASC